MNLKVVAFPHMVMEATNPAEKIFRMPIVRPLRMIHHPMKFHVIKKNVSPRHKKGLEVI